MLPIDDRSVAQALEALRSGRPVVIPAPSPLAYAVTGIDAAAVNTAKGRARGQPVGVSLADIDVIAPYLDLAGEELPLARWLSEEELVSLMVPARPHFPGWLAPAVSNGLVLFTAAPWLPELAKIIDSFGHLYLSSANLTSEPSVTTAAQADRAFGDDLIVLDGDTSRDQARAHGSTTIVRMGHPGGLTVARAGINNAAFGPDLAGYADDLSRRWRARQSR